MVKIVETDEDLIKVLPLVVRYRMEMDYSLKQMLREVGDAHLIVYVEGDEGLASGYLLGNFIMRDQFFLIQAYSSDPKQMPLMNEVLERVVLGEEKEVTIETFFRGDNKVNRRYYEGYGYSYERTLVKKTLRKEE